MVDFRNRFKATGTLPTMSFRVASPTLAILVSDLLAYFGSKEDLQKVADAVAKRAAFLGVTLEKPE